MPQVQQVAGGEFAAGDIVDRHRTPLGAGQHPVDEDERDGLPPEGGEVAPGHIGRGHQHPAHALFGEESEVVGLLLGALGAVAHHHPQPRLPRRTLRTARHVHEERVRHVQHQQRDDAAAPRAQLTRGLLAYIAQALDRGQHPVARGLGHRLRAVDDVGDRADRDPGLARHLFDAHPGCHPSGGERDVDDAEGGECGAAEQGGGQCGDGQWSHVRSFPGALVGAERASVPTPPLPTASICGSAAWRGSAPGPREFRGHLRPPGPGRGRRPEPAMARQGPEGARGCVHVRLRRGCVHVRLRRVGDQPRGRRGWPTTDRGTFSGAFTRGGRPP
ncbi:hypothetical protein SANTM175S_10641 [Streptomyces antimycoticus]